jgi:hypothetical protein
MEEQFDAFNLGVSWSQFGYSDQALRSELYGENTNLTVRNKFFLEEMWAKHPNRQQDTSLNNFGDSFYNLIIIFY